MKTPNLTGNNTGILLQGSLYKMATELGGLSRQVVFHNREYGHCENLCGLCKTFPVSFYRFHCMIIVICSITYYQVFVHLHVVSTQVLYTWCIRDDVFCLFSSVCHEWCILLVIQCVSWMMHSACTPACVMNDAFCLYTSMCHEWCILLVHQRVSWMMHSACSPVCVMNDAFCL